MSALKLSTAQAALVAFLTAAQAGTQFPDLQGIPIAVESYANDDADDVINAALDENGPGIVIFSALPFAVRISDSSPGTQQFMASLVLFVLENPKTNMDTAHGGLSRDPMKVVEAIWSAVAAKPSGRPQTFHIADPLEPVTETSGFRMWATTIETQILFKP